MILNLITWAFIIASLYLPQRWFKDKDKWRAYKMSLAAVATGIAIAGLISIFI